MKSNVIKQRVEIFGSAVQVLRPMCYLSEGCIMNTRMAGKIRMELYLYGSIW